MTAHSILSALFQRIKEGCPLQLDAGQKCYRVNRMLFCFEGYFTAPINALSASSDGQQQPSTPLFGFGASLSTSISTGQPVIGAPVKKSVLADVPVKKSVLALFLTTTDGKKISVFVAFGRAGGANASALVALPDAFAGGVVEWGLLSGRSFQHRLEPCK
jgi:hypothetical protein